ncbi:MAG: PhnD/SsuA/transferrin family substrate-binding protein [Caulobacterales bacterium]
MIKRALLALAFLGAPAVQAAAPAPLRLAIEGLPPGPCAPAPQSPAGLSTYTRLLETRLGRPVLACPVADKAAAAAALASGGVDLAMLDPQSFPAAGKARPILAPHSLEDFGRVEMIFAAMSTSPRAGPKGLAGARLALAGAHPVAAGGPLRVAQDAGIAPTAFAAVASERDPEAAIAAVRAGRADVAAFHAAAWRRLCRTDKPGEQPCKDLKVVYAARPQARLALVAPLSMPDELRYRLIGIHIAMHLEAPEAFAFAARGATGAVSFDPTEASALSAPNP